MKVLLVNFETNSFIQNTVKESLLAVVDIHERAGGYSMNLMNSLFSVT